MIWLKDLVLDPVDQCIQDTHLRTLESLNHEIGVLDSEIASSSLESEEALLLITLTGLDYNSACLQACIQC
jgi:hypothetical protein